jgi:hypothetical protein
MMSLIIVLYVCVMITMGADWSTLNHAFVANGQTADTVVDALNDAPLVANLLPNVAKIIAILIADSILVCYYIDLLSASSYAYYFTTDLAMLGCLATIMGYHFSAHCDDSGFSG